MNLLYTLPFLLLVGAGTGPEANSRKVATFACESHLVQEQDATVQEPALIQEKQKAQSMSDADTSKVISKMNVQKVTLTKNSGEGNIIEVRVTDSGLTSSGFPGLQLIGSSGTTINLNNNQSFRNVAVPFEGIVRFRSTNNVGNIEYEREVRFEITETGKWVLLIEI